MTHFGLQLPSFTFADVPDDRLFERIAEIAGAAEDAGFDSFWVMDHYHQIANIGPRTEPMLEAYTLLGGVAARTSRIQLGAMVTGVTYRNPAFLAKVVTTLDVVSSGRAILGIGAAWNEEESRAYGYAWPPVAERFERLEDALRICRSMFTQPESTVPGTVHHVEGAMNVPQPVRPGRTADPRRRRRRAQDAPADRSLRRHVERLRRSRDGPPQARGPVRALRDRRPRPIRDRRHPPRHADRRRHARGGRPPAPCLAGRRVVSTTRGSRCV